MGIFAKCFLPTTLLVFSADLPLECRCPRLHQDYPTIWSNYTHTHTHTSTHPRQTSAHMHAPRHSLKLSFKHTRPCKVLLSAEERSQASFALALCSQHVQRCLSLAGGPTGPTDAQRDGREDVSKTTDGGCTQGQERLIRPKDL